MYDGTTVVGAGKLKFRLRTGTLDNCDSQNRIDQKTVQSRKCGDIWGIRNRTRECIVEEVWNGWNGSLMAEPKILTV